MRNRLGMRDNSTLLNMSFPCSQQALKIPAYWIYLNAPNKSQLSQQTLLQHHAGLVSKHSSKKITVKKKFWFIYLVDPCWNHEAYEFLLPACFSWPFPGHPASRMTSPGFCMPLKLVEFLFPAAVKVKTSAYYFITNNSFHLASERRLLSLVFFVEIKSTYAYISNKMTESQFLRDPFTLGTTTAETKIWALLPDSSTISPTRSEHRQWTEGGKCLLFLTELGTALVKLGKKQWDKQLMWYCVGSVKLNEKGEQNYAKKCKCQPLHCCWTR